MKREKTIRSNFDYLDSEVNVTKFLKLISKDQTRKDVGEKIELLKSFKGHEAEHQAAYLLRLGESMIKVRNDIEEKIGTIKKFWPILPSPKIKSIHIGVEPVSGYDPDIGNYNIHFQDTSIVELLGNKYLILDASAGICGIIFQDGLPATTSVIVNVNWTAQLRKGILYGNVSPSKEQNSTGASGSDFVWINNDSNNFTSMCVKNGDNTHQIHLGMDIYLILW